MDSVTSVSNGWTGLVRARRSIAVSGFAVAAAIAAFATQPAAALGMRPTQPSPQSATLVLPVAVFGRDDRVSLPPRYAGLEDRMGLLFNNHSQTVCTAFCVAPSVIATAAHCIFRTKGETPPKIEAFWFARNYETQRDFARIAGYATGSAPQNVLSGTTKLRVRPPIDAASDWALVRLARAVCRKGVFPIRPMKSDEVQKESASGRIFQISYHRDFANWRVAYSRPCTVARDYKNAGWDTIKPDFAHPENLLLHTCDTGGASSGSPLLIDLPGGPEVVGINVGTYVQSRVVMQNGQVTHRYKADTIANTGVTVLALSERLAAMRRATILASGRPMQELQVGLRALGHYTGPIDGTYGRGTRAAIEAFEQALGLRRTGIASEQVLRALIMRRGRHKPTSRATTDLPRLPRSPPPRQR